MRTHCAAWPPICASPRWSTARRAFTSCWRRHSFERSESRSSIRTRNGLAGCRHPCRNGVPRPTGQIGKIVRLLLEAIRERRLIDALSFATGGAGVRMMQDVPGLKILPITRLNKIEVLRERLCVVSYMQPRDERAGWVRLRRAVGDPVAAAARHPAVAKLRQFGIAQRLRRARIAPAHVPRRGRTAPCRRS